MPQSYPPGYNRLRERVMIDPARLDHEVTEHPTLIMEVCEMVADAAEQRDRAINDLDWLKARTRRELREDQKPGEKRLTNDEIDAMISLDKEVLKSTEGIERAKHDLGLWNGLLEAFRSKGSSMKRLGELMHAGYTASASVLKTPHEHLDEARCEGNKRTRKDF